MRLNSFASAADTYSLCLHYDDAYERPSSTLFDDPPEATAVLHPHLEEGHPLRSASFCPLRIVCRVGAHKVRTLAMCRFIADVAAASRLACTSSRS